MWKIWKKRRASRFVPSIRASPAATASSTERWPAKSAANTAGPVVTTRSGSAAGSRGKQSWSARTRTCRRTSPSRRSAERSRPPATSASAITAFVAAGLTGAKLVGRFGVKRLLVVGLTLGAVGMALLTRIEPGATYVSDLLPALILAGLAIGLSAPTVQIGALTGVAPRTVGLASGLVERMREVGGAVGIAAASTVLASRSIDAEALTDPVAREAALFDSFQSAFTVTLVLAVLGVLVAAIGFPRMRSGEPATDETVAEPALTASGGT